MQQDQTRLLSLSGTTNVRDLGGYPAREGGVTLWRRYLRSDSLHALDASGLQQLLDYGVTTVIDLRHHLELTESPNPLAEQEAVAYHNIPMFEPPAESVGQQLNMPASLSQMYRHLLDERQAAFQQIFTTMADAGPGVVLFHCTVGKDRTGLVAALLLSLAGVAAPVIVEDYSQSATNIAPLTEGFRQRLADSPIDVDPTVFAHMMSSEPQTMVETLAHLDTKYGGPLAYLQHTGLTQAHLDRITARLLDERA